MRNSNFFVYLLIILFFSLVGWLFYASFQHMKQGDTSFKEGIGKTLSKANEKTKDMIAGAGEGVSKATNKIKNKGKNLKDAAGDTAEEYLYYDKEDDEPTAAATAKELEKTLAAKKAKAAAEQKAIAAKEKLAKEKAALAKANELTEKGNASKDIVVNEPKASSEKINKKPAAKNTPKAYNSVKSKGATSTAKANTANEYFVIAGSFSIAENANKAAKDFKKKGYKETEVVSFASTKYKSVSLKRFSTRAAADKMITSLKQKNIDAYVHKKRYK